MRRSHDELRIISPPDTCSYLPAETSSLEYVIPKTMTAGRFEALLARGWRRFGDYYFRPKCPGCTACRPLRIDLTAFRRTKSQRRAVRKNSHIRLLVQRPSVTEEHIDVFNQYHADMHLRRDWPLRRITVDEYVEGFIGNDVGLGYEFLYFDDNRLMGVGLVDQTPGVSSGAYFYHRPEWRDASPGTYSLLCELEYAREHGRRFHYLGYWIRDCPSMAYKSRFGPHELLESFVREDEEPVWHSGPSR